MKDFLTLAKERYSVRKFTAEPVSAEDLDKILEAGMAAPTACNLQPQRVFVLNTADTLDKLKKCTPCHFDAPAALLVCFNSEETWKRKYDGETSGWVDASIVTTHMMLEAADLGIGSTWVMWFDPAAVRTEFALADELVPAAILVMGHAAPDAAPSPMHAQSRARAELIR